MERGFFLSALRHSKKLALRPRSQSITQTVSETRQTARSAFQPLHAILLSQPRAAPCVRHLLRDRYFVRIASGPHAGEQHSRCVVETPLNSGSAGTPLSSNLPTSIPNTATPWFQAVAAEPLPRPARASSIFRSPSAHRPTFRNDANAPLDREFPQESAARATIKRIAPPSPGA